MSKKKSLTHSEVVRRKRRSATQQPRPQKRKSRAKGKSGYRELPPITARGVVNEFALERRKKAGKRRFNAILSLPRLRGLSRSADRDLSLPKRRIRASWRLLSITLLLLLGTGLYLFWTLPEFRVNAARISGNQRITTEELNAALELNGNPIFLLTPAQLRERALRAYPELASVDVTVDLPNIVTVKVTEREPVILWQQGGGYAWIDKTGTAFRPRGDAPGLIVVQALGTPPAISNPDNNPLVPAPFISEETVKALTELAPYVPAGTPILYDPVKGLSWTDGRGWQAVFGTGDGDVETKVRVYQAMVDWLTQRGIRPILINVAYPNAPFYRLEQVDTQAKAQ
jgi:hypothetical protein